MKLVLFWIEKKIQKTQQVGSIVGRKKNIECVWL
jgi:hypothetical protein